MSIQRTARYLSVLAFTLFTICKSHAGLVGHWVASDLPTGNVTSWNDRVSSIPATNSGNPAKAASGGVVFDGNDALTVSGGNNPAAGDNTISLTIAFVVNSGATRSGLDPNNVNTWWGNSMLVGRELGGSNRGDWGVGINSEQEALVGRGNPDTGIIASTALNDGEVHIATGVFNGSSNSVSLFVDGSKIGEQPGAGSTNIETEALHFGVNLLGAGDTVYFTGEILEIQIDNTALSDASVSSLQASLLSAYSPGPTLSSFTATPNNIFEGQSASLAWSLTGVTGALSLDIDQGVPAISGSSGSISDSPLTTTTYTFTATDSSGSSTETASVTVDPGIPAANPQSIATTAGTSNAITLTASDPNNHPNPTLTYSIVSPPSGGTLTGSAPNLTYNPSGGFSGNDSFTFKVNDGKYDSPTVIVSITVVAPPTAPSDLKLSTTSIGDNVGNSGFIATLKTTDINPADNHSYSLIAGAGSTDNSLFTIVGNQLRAATNFVGLVGNTYSIRLRTLDNSGRSYQESVTLTVIAVSDAIVINEIHYNPPENPIRQEFIELHNPSASTADLSGWSLTSAVDFVFPDGTSIAPGGFLIIAEDPATMLSTLGATAIGPFSGSLNSDGETIRLRDANDNIVDEVDYKIGFPWPVASNGNGASIELINPTLDNGLGSSWRASFPESPLAAATLLALADNGWSWRPGSSEASTPTYAWREATFVEDGTWQPAQTPIGYGNVNSVTFNTTIPSMQNSHNSLFLRNTFTIAPGEIPSQLELNFTADDGFIAWINGIEVERRRFDENENPTIDDTANALGTEGTYESATIPNPGVFLVEGSNTITIMVFNEQVGSSDLGFDLEILRPAQTGDIPLPSPGSNNTAFAPNAAPNIRKVKHTPEQPTAADIVTITAKVTDPEGVDSVTLEYQINAAGAYIPARLPHPISGNNINTTLPRPENPSYESTWTSLPMTDDGTGGDALAGDDIYTAIIPAQPHRSLVRYRVTVEDGLAKSERVPYPDDASLNFAYFVYDGVPDYNGHTAAALQTLPVYHIITRGEDYADCIAYNSGDQINQGSQARFLYNWNATIVYDGIIYDNIRFRLRGANGRYYSGGKRSMRFRLNDGYFFQARDQSGKKYPEKWRTLTTGKGFDNKLTLTHGLNEAVNMYLFNKVGVPAINTHWVHWRVIDGASESPDQWTGDFHGFNLILETYDVRFMDAHGLEKGNLYKLINQTSNWQQQQRYQAAAGVTDGSDHNNIESNLDGSDSAAYIEAHVNLDKWNRLHSLVEAIRHYDYWPSSNKNMVYYFEPDYLPANNNLGKLWVLPWDTDATWGPNWNQGHDVVYNSLFNASGGGSDNNSTPELWPDYFNTIREMRDLLWQPDQIEPLIDEFTAFLTPMEAADSDRWKNAPSNSGNYNGLGGAGATSVSNLAQDMKGFAFTGWTGSSGPNIGAGGRGAFLDSLQASQGEGGKIPNTPTITYTGTANSPTNGISFQSSNFTDPQSNNSFGAMQWRIAQIHDPSAPNHDPTARFKLEYESDWESGSLTTFNNAIDIPTIAVRSGLTYRARVRHQDDTGRWSHWSAPAEFTTTLPDISDYITGLVITEVNYHPSDPTAAEITAGYDDDDFFEYIEIMNVGNITLNLQDLRFTKGADFDFLGSAITSLAPGEIALVVNNLAAFELRYGTGKPVAGAWETGDKLSNGGEQIKLSFGAGDAIRDFTYNDVAPWPTAPDGGGVSLTLREPNQVLNHALATSWRSSYASNGTPGTNEATTGFGDWQTLHFGPGSPNGSGALEDQDNDSLPNLIEYALGSDPLNPASAGSIEAIIVNTSGKDYQALRYTRPIGLTDLALIVELSTDLDLWNSGTGFTIEQGSPTNNGDGTETIVIRSFSEFSSLPREFLRLRVQQLTPL